MTRLYVVLAVVLSAMACNKVSDETPDGGIATLCSATSECSAAHVCIAGHCGLPNSISLGQSCSANRDCSSGLYCGPTGQCATGGNQVEGGACSSDGDCLAPSLRCDYTGFTGTCQQGGTSEVGQSCFKQAECLPGLFCGVTQECEQYAVAFPPFAGVNCLNDSTGFHSYFEVPRAAKPLTEFYRLPYPNDIRVSGTPKVLDLSDFPDPGPTAADADIVKLYTTALSTDFDGFSPSSYISFRFNKDIKFESVGDNIRLIDLDTKADVVDGSLIYSYSAGQDTKYNCSPFLTIAPGLAGVPLIFGHTYGMILTDGLLGADGTTATVDPDLAALLSATRPASDADLQRAWDDYQKLRDALADGGVNVPATRVINAAVFTVANPAAHMQRLAAAVATEPTPTLSDVTLCGAGVTGPCGTDALHACGSSPDFIEIQGKISMPIYQQGTAPYLTPADGGNIKEVGGVPQKVRNEDVCFTMTLPNGTAPAGGWPLVVYGHGTGGSMRDFITSGIAKALATSSTPVAVFSYDSVGHGARRGTSTADPGTLVFNVLNPLSARDNFLQGAADILTALKLPSVAAPVGFTFKFDATKVGFYGHSQGADHGQLALPYTNVPTLAVLTGAGSNLTYALLEKTNPIDVAKGIEFLLSDQLISDVHPAIVLFQTWLDRSDPVNYGRMIIQSPPEGINAKKVYQAWGTGDTESPPSTLCWTSRMLGLQPVGTVLEMTGGDDRCQLFGPTPRPVTMSAMFQYMTASGHDGHFVATDVPAAVADWTAFITSTFSTGSINVP